jgi:VWFA-related protein
VTTLLTRQAVLGALLCVARAMPSAAQVPTIPTESQIVHVDVIVTTRRGGVVRDLTLRDFVLLEDGREVPITAFQPPAAPQLGDSAASPSLGPDRPQGPASRDPSEAETLVVYVDNLNLTLGGRRRLLGGLSPFLAAQLASGRGRALVLAEDRGLRALTQLTTSAADVARALVEAERPFPGGQLAVQAERTTLDTVKSTIETLPCESGSDCVCLLPLLQSIVRSHAEERQHQLRATLARLAEVAAILGTLPGPKTLFYLSDGVDQRPAAHLFHQLGDICPEAYQRDFSTLLAPMQEYDLSRALQDLAAHANTARLTIYPLDGAGLQAPSLADVSRVERRYTPSPRTDAVQKANREAGEWILGEETGGYPILNTNNPARALAGVAQELSGRYVLGFTPDRNPDGRAHRIRVELRRKGLRARYRPSYFHGERAAEVVARTLVALVAGIEADTLGALVSARPEPTRPESDAGQADQASVRISVPLGRLAAVQGEEEDAPVARLRIVIAIRTGSDGKASAPEVRDKYVDVPIPAGAPGLPAGSHDVVVSVPVSGDEGEIAVGVQDVASGLATYRRIPVRRNKKEPRGADPPGLS